MFKLVASHLLMLDAWKLCQGRILGIVGQDPSVSKSNRLHVVILRFH